MKITIIGCGYVGMALASELTQLGHQVVATTTQETRLSEISRVATHAVIAKDAMGIQQAVQGAEKIVVLVTPKGALSVAKALSQCSNVYYSSATSVYSENSGGTVTEESSLNPNDPLVEIENTFLRETCIFRLAGIYGPGRELDARARNLSGKEVSGSGSFRMNKIHLDIIVKAFIWAMDQKLTGIYNLSEDDHPTRDECYGLILKEEELPPIRWNPMLGSRHSKNKIVSSKKIKNAGFNQF